MPNNGDLDSLIQQSTKFHEKTNLISEKFKLLYHMLKSFKSEDLNNNQDEIIKLLDEITTYKKEILKIDRQRDLLPSEIKAVLAGMNAIIRYINESNNNLIDKVFYIWTLTDQNDFSSTMHRVYQDAYKKEYNSQNEKIKGFINHLQKIYPVFNDIIIMQNKKEVVEKLFYNLSILFTPLNENIGDNALVTTKLAEIEKDLMNLLNDRFIEEPIPFRKAVIKKAIEQCIENMSPAPDFNSFISKFLYPLTEHEFKKVKHEIHSKIIQDHDKKIHRLYEEKYEYIETEVAVEERIFNDLLSHHLGRFDVDIAKSIYLEQANSDTNSDLQSLTYSQAATIARIIHVNAPNLESDIATTSKIITTISLKILRSEGIEEDIQSLVDLISKSHITNTDDSVWKPNLGPVIDSALKIIEALADTLTTDRTCIDTAIFDYEGIFDKENIGLNTGCFFNARKNEIGGNREDGLGNGPFQRIEP